MQVVYRVEDTTFEIFEEIILKNTDKKWVKNFRSYIRDSGSQLMSAGLLGFFVLLCKKANKTDDSAYAYTALLYGCVKFLERSGLLEDSKITERYSIGDVLNGTGKEEFIKTVLARIAEVNKDLQRRMFFTDMLMKHLTWMKNFTEAVVG